MALTAPTDRVLVSSPTVTFLRPDSDAAVIRIRANAATDYVVNRRAHDRDHGTGGRDRVCRALLGRFLDGGLPAAHPRGLAAGGGRPSR